MSFMTATDTFNRHLETCKQCAGNPFNLCLIGAIWIKKAADESSAKLVNQLRRD